MITIQGIVLILHGKSYNCILYIYEISAKVPKYLDCELFVDPLHPGGILYTMIFCNFIIDEL